MFWYTVLYTVGRVLCRLQKQESRNMFSCHVAALCLLLFCRFLFFGRVDLHRITLVRQICLWIPQRFSC